MAMVTTTIDGYAIQHRDYPALFLGENGIEQRMPMMISSPYYAEQHIGKARDRTDWQIVECHVSVQCNVLIPGEPR